MNGAQALIRTLVDAGVDVCFMNPGTSEMHFVAALDDVPEMRGVLALFEGVATGAADGYARMAGKPAATLLHLGPGLGNGLANLHNARKAFTPIVNIVGDHATYHQQYDAQLQSDIETVARNVSSWIRASDSPKAVAGDAADAVAAAIGPPGQVATLILPADVSWSEGGEPAPPRRRRPRSPVDADAGRRPGRASCRTTSRPRSSWAGGPAGPAPWSTPAASPTPPGPSCSPRPSRPASSGAPAGSRSTASPTWPSSPRCSSTASATWSSSTPSRRCRSSPTPTRPATSCPRAAPSTSSPAATAIPARRWPPSPTRSARRRRRHPAARGRAPTCPPVRSPPTPSARSSVRSCPRARSCPTRATPSGLFAAGHTAGAPPHDWLCLTGGAIGQGLPVAARARRWPPRPAGRSPSRPTARPCTRSRRGGRWRASTSTSPPSSSTTRPTPCSTWSSSGSGPPPAARRPRRCSTSTAPTSTSSPSPPAWASPPPGPPPARSWPTSSRQALDTTGPTVIEAVVPSIL